ncbi:MAG: hypothetical protein V1766_07145 [Pseudomonadota bacterium]
MMKCCEQIPMPNGLTAEVHDLSRQIAADTVRVEMVIRIPVALRPDDFAEPSRFEQTRAVFGEEIVYEHRLERSFVSSGQKDDVFRTLLETFKQASLPYLTSPRFRTRFAEFKYLEILQNPYKYRHRQDNPTESA